MSQKRYSVFGAGAAGLYTAWRLLGGGNPKGSPANAKALKRGDTLELCDWGKYDFDKDNSGTRESGARVCTWHYKDDRNASYLEVGGMRYSDWDGTPEGSGHRVVTTVIKELGLDKDSIPFDVSTNQLFCLRTKNMYLNDITSSNPAPYNVNNFGATTSPDAGFTTLQNLALTPAEAQNMTRKDWCKFYTQGKIAVELPESSVYKKGDHLKDIGYWNLMFDQLGSEGYRYTADGNGYTSNVINWNTADAIQANNEFAPGTVYKTLKTGYSSMFAHLFQAIRALAEKEGVHLDYRYNTRLHSILSVNGRVRYWTATRENPDKATETRETDAAWLAMPRFALDLVSQATRYQPHEGLDVLNHPKVQLYLEAAIMQPSYKVGMFFDQEWWVKSATPQPPYPAPIDAWEITQDVLVNLVAAGFPAEYAEQISEAKPPVINTSFASKPDLFAAVEGCTGERLTVAQENLLTKVARRNTIGPSVTDMPVRQVVYFGNNALADDGKPVYGLLAAYDDEQFTTFWQELELGPNRERTVAISQNYQPLEGPRTVPPGMEKMLRAQLAAIHFGPSADYSAVPKPLESRYMDWSLPPFNAGYHVWATHYDIGDVQRKIRKPSQLTEGADANIFIVGETYSNDQAWVEGAYCSSESVLKDFFGFTPIIPDEDYPFICEC